jgi:CheY-like chemotaxis protein
MTNAVKFTPPGGKVQVRLTQVKSHLEIAVSDTGIGITREFLPFIFDRFRQADSGSTREQGGLGLGLGIARQLVEMHGGRIHAASDGPGTGTTFRVELPLMVVHRQAPADERVQARAESMITRIAVPDLHDVRVLAVDDDPDALEMVSEILEATGAEVVIAHSAREALDVLQVVRPDVLVADLGMPHMDGFELIARVRCSTEGVRDVPAAAVTAYARSEDRAKALKSGFQIHLSKPIDPAELMAAIATLARRTTAIEPF